MAIWGIATALTLLTIGEWRLALLLAEVMRAGSGGLDLLVEVPRAVLGGTAGAVYGNRALAPAVIGAVGKVMALDWPTAVRVFLAVAIALKNVAVYALARRLTGEAKVAVMATGTVAIGLALLPNGLPLFPWDWIDVAVFSTFLWLAAQAAPAGYFLPLALIGLVNREAAIVIPLFLILRGWTGTDRRGDWLWAGIILVLGLDLLIALRVWPVPRWALGAPVTNTIVLTPPSDWVFLTVGGLTFAQITALDNLVRLSRSVTNWHALAGAWQLTLMLVGFAVMLAHRGTQWARREVAVLGAFAGLAVLTFLFGIYDEGRVYADWLPFALYIALRR